MGDDPATRGGVNNDPFSGWPSGQSVLTKGERAETRQGRDAL